MLPHVTVLHRVRGIEVPYLERIDHHTNSVTYICMRNATDGIPADMAARVAIVDDMAEAAVIMRDLIHTFGTPEHLVSLSEFDQVAAAELRAEFGIAGYEPEQILGFRDKLVMGTRVTSAGTQAPPFADAPDTTAVEKFAEVHGYPLIIKPRLGAASRDIVRIDSADDMSLVPDLTNEPYLVQLFCPDDIGAVDGVWTGTGLGPWRASRYVGNCLDFAITDNSSLASVEIDDDRLNEPLAEFTTAVLAALSPGMPTVFHLEFFAGDGADRPRLQFLEVGARISGGQVTDLWREVHGYDLVGAAIDCQMGRLPDATPLAGDTITADLQIHPPITPPCAVVHTHLDLPAEYRPYHSSVPEPGTVITETHGYFEIGATFRFRGHSTAEVTEAVRRTIGGFRMDCRPVEPAHA
ncbi:ATP-grasp domain-containing protein [Nocardia alni]|uniref:ATP-grasp domain-containing protein n=1 Tax=Nocardia alni TaxID=2815723 RepID=UPI001C233906|nr:hypothetical protein [Nocardia alni]